MTKRQIRIRWFYSLVLGLVLGLAACARPAAPPVVAPELPDAPALFNDADVDAATAAYAESLTLLDGLEIATTIAEHELEALPETFVSQVVLPSASGFIAYINHNSDTDAWQVFIADQATDSRTRVYTGRRQLESVATSLDGNTIAMVMRRAVSPTSSFEVYLLRRNPDTLEQVTLTDYDEGNVSLSADGQTLVWEGLRNGFRAVFIRRYDGSSFTESVLIRNQDQVQPSVTGDGAHIAMVRKQLNGNNLVLLYGVYSNSYTNVHNSSNLLEHPSATDGGEQVAFLEHLTNTFRVRLKNNATGAITSLHSNANGVGHPHLTADGKFLTFTQLVNGSWNVFSRDISSGQRARTAGTSLPNNAYAPYWAKAVVPKRLLFDLSHLNHNYLDPSDPNNIDDAWSLGGWRDTLVADGWQVDKVSSGPITLALLQAYDSFVISPPRQAFTQAEVSAIEQYVAGGGSVLFIGEFAFENGGISSTGETETANEPAHEPANEAADETSSEAIRDENGVLYDQPGQRLNQVAAPFGLHLDLTSSGTQTTTNLAAHPVNAGNTSYSYSSASSVSGGQTVFMTSGHNRLMATVSYGNGCAAIIGDTNVWSDNYGITLVDNAALARNTLTYLLDCPAVTQVTRSLTVAKAGAGTGNVTSSPLGISCGSTCTATYLSTVTVTLTATPTGGSTFSGWSGGGCSGTGSCTVTMNQNRNVTASFAAPTFSVSGVVTHSSAWLSSEPLEAPNTSADSGKAPTFDGAPYGEALQETSLGIQAAWPGSWDAALPGLHYEPNEVLVGFKSSDLPALARDMTSLSEGEVAALNAQLQTLAAAVASDYNLTVMGTSPLLGVTRLRFAEGMKLEAMLTELAKDPRVAYVEPNGLYHAHQLEPSAPSRVAAESDVGITATHPTGNPFYSSQAWHYSFVGAQRGWDTQRGATNVRVAVIDTGYRWDHPDGPVTVANERDFVANSSNYNRCAGGTIPRAWDQSGYDTNAMDWMQYGWNNTSQCVTNPSGAGSHGTHVIGTIAAAWNSVGGVGLNRNLTIIPLQALDVKGSGTWYDIAQAVLYAGGLAADNGSGGTVSMTRAHIANMSLGGDSSSTTLSNAVTSASNNGLLIIASAGNEGNSVIQYPAGYSNVVAVTSIGANGGLASYSSFGSWVELTAPGGDFNTSPNLGVLSNTFNYSGCSQTPGTFCDSSNGGAANYGNYHGTSMAAPHVSGIAALYLAHTSGLNRAQLRQALRDRAFDWGATGFDNSFGYGLAHVRPGTGVARVTSSGGRRVQLINATSGVPVATAFTDANGNYSFSSVPNGSYYVLAASNGAPTNLYGATGSSISAYRAGDSGWFQGASVLTVNGANQTGINITLGWPGFQTSNGSAATPAFMHPGYYAAITYSTSFPERWFRIRVPTAGTYRIWTDGFNSPDRCSTLFGDFDTVLELYQANGTTLISSNDDASGRGLCSQVTQFLSAGTYMVKVRAFGSGGANGQGTILRFDPQ